MGTTQEKVKKAYDALMKSERDPRDSWDYILSKMQTDYRLLSKINIRGKTILNIGCSYPIDEIYFASKISKWVSIDISPETIKKARVLCDYELPRHLSQKISFIEADASKLPFDDESFDIVVSFSTIDHIPGKNKRESVCKEIFRVTKKGGYAIVTVPNKLSIFYYMSSKHKSKDTSSFWYEHCFTPIELKKLLQKSGFEIVEFTSTLSGRTGARGRIIGIIVGGIEKYILQYFGRRMGYLCYKSKSRL